MLKNKKLDFIAGIISALLLLIPIMPAVKIGDKYHSLIELGMYGLIVALPQIIASSVVLGMAVMRKNNKTGRLSAGILFMGVVLPNIVIELYNLGDVLISGAADVNIILIPHSIILAVITMLLLISDKNTFKAVSAKTRSRNAVSDILIFVAMILQLVTMFVPYCNVINYIKGMKLAILYPSAPMTDSLPLGTVCQLWIPDYDVFMIAVSLSLVLSVYVLCSNRNKLLLLVTALPQIFLIGFVVFLMTGNVYRGAAFDMIGGAAGIVNVGFILQVLSVIITFIAVFIGKSKKASK